jgi:glutamine amidotransferase
MRISVVDYGVGNLHSISKGLERAGASVTITSDMSSLEAAECIVFPGVGAFGAAMEKLKLAIPSLRRAAASGTPILGICLGMQVLFERSEESAGEGVGLFRGSVKRLDAPRVPHMGWNEVSNTDDPLFAGVPQGSRFYFANSYVCHPMEKVGISETLYGETFVSAVRKGRVCGVQFHPEKSGMIGLKLLSNFVRMAEGSS